jgi:DNA-binding response OmpR family regulator
MSNEITVAAQLVLIVDDEPIIIELVQCALEDGGFAVQLAYDDDETFAALEKNRGREFAAFVTDVNLGRKRTGWEIGRRARELNPLMPVVYVTGDGAGEYAIHGVPDSSLVPKPFAPAQLVVALAGLITAAQAMATAVLRDHEKAQAGNG